MNKKQQNNQTTHRLAPPPYPSPNPAPKGEGSKMYYMLVDCLREEVLSKLLNIVK